MLFGCLHREEKAKGTKGAGNRGVGKCLFRVHFNTHRVDSCSRLASKPSRGKPGGCPPCARSEPSAFGSGIATRNSAPPPSGDDRADRKSTRLNSSHANISYAVFCLN